ncbi:hypothetical protein P9139_02935 [Curtobacterium flaccumfaciens]|nr:hypothetical protein P9139_02935 [Curtobacterium flaccumfaciens]
MAAATSPQIFAGRTAEMGAPTPAESIAPAVLRGAAVSDLPDTDDLARIAVPALVLAWDTDPAHPVSTALAVADALPNAELRTATSVDDIAEWGHRATEFLNRAR